MLPVAGRGGQLAGGLRGFFLRRSRRILPPYYFALAGTLVALAVIPACGPYLGFQWAARLEPFNLWDIAAHVLLLHNLSLAMMYRIDYPMWSVATEWQIYFAFALFLLPLWRLFGTGAMLTAAFTAVYFLNAVDQFPRFHFLGLFALGMAGAEIAVAPKSARWKSLPWGVFTAILFGGLYFALLMKPDVFWRRLVFADTGVGLITVCLILHCASQLSARRSDGLVPAPNLILRLLQSRFAVTIGVFSYSLYLVHAPILALVEMVTARAGLGPVADLAVYELLGVPLALLISYAFFLACEKPFLIRHKKETFAEVARDAALSPAP